jgi:hypothetical protein
MTVPTQDPHAQPPDVGRAVRAIRMPCEVPVACSPHHQWSADDGLHPIDGTCRPVASGDPHVSPSVWQDHGDTAGRRHEPWSSHRQQSSLWDGDSRRMEGLCRGCYRPVTPPTFPWTRRTGRRRASTPGGSQLTSTPARRMLSFKAMLGLVFGI